MALEWWIKKMTVYSLRLPNTYIPTFRIPRFWNKDVWKNCSCQENTHG